MYNARRKHMTSHWKLTVEPEANSYSNRLERRPEDKARVGKASSCSPSPRESPDISCDRRWIQPTELYKFPPGHHNTFGAIASVPPGFEHQARPTRCVITSRRQEIRILNTRQVAATTPGHQEQKAPWRRLSRQPEAAVDLRMVLGGSKPVLSCTLHYGLLSDGAYVGLPAMRRASCWMIRIEDRSQGPSDVGMEGKMETKINWRSWAVQTQVPRTFVYEMRSVVNTPPLIPGMCLWLASKHEADLADVRGDVGTPPRLLCGIASPARPLRTGGTFWGSERTGVMRTRGSVLVPMHLRAHELFASRGSTLREER
ncbi:hypothetical protein BDW22DRAFT_1349416 [Trametopsis cervina]|nr:hypothetical protein BDW22DRAFT_1349416 [Trametopsis cervina]